MSPGGERRSGRLRRPERLLPFACIAGAAALCASEFMTTFQLTPPGGQALCVQEASDRHHFALGVVALLVVALVVVALVWVSKPAATAAGIAGVLPLLLFLTIDLPDANNVGTLAGCSTTTAGSFFEAKALPQAGFWLEMVGALALALSAVALATLSPEQVATTRPGWLRRHEPPGPEPAHTAPAPRIPRAQSNPRPAAADHPAGADESETRVPRPQGARGGPPPST